MKFTEAITALIAAPPWSMKVARTSDGQVAMVRNCTGKFVRGSKDSTQKRWFRKLHLTVELFQANDYEIVETDCEWVK